MKFIRSVFLGWLLVHGYAYAVVFPKYYLQTMQLRFDSYQAQLRVLLDPRISVSDQKIFFEKKIFSECLNPHEMENILSFFPEHSSPKSGVGLTLDSLLSAADAAVEKNFSQLFPQYVQHCRDMLLGYETLIYLVDLHDHFFKNSKHFNRTRSPNLKCSITSLLAQTHKVLMGILEITASCLQDQDKGLRQAVTLHVKNFYEPQKIVQIFIFMVLNHMLQKDKLFQCELFKLCTSPLQGHPSDAEVCGESVYLMFLQNILKNELPAYARDEIKCFFLLYHPENVKSSYEQRMRAWLQSKEEVLLKPVQQKLTFLYNLYLNTHHLRSKKNLKKVAYNFSQVQKKQTMLDGHYMDWIAKKNIFFNNLLRSSDSHATPKALQASIHTLGGYVLSMDAWALSIHLDSIHMAYIAVLALLGSCFDNECKVFYPHGQACLVKDFCHGIITDAKQQYRTLNKP